MKRIVALVLAAALSAGAPAMAENSSYNPFVGAKEALNKAKAQAEVQKGRAAEVDAESAGKNDGPPADTGADQGGNNVTGPRATARNVLATKGVDTSQPLTADQKRTVQEKVGEWKGEKNDVATKIAQTANQLKELENRLKNTDPQTEYQMDDEGNPLEVAGNQDYIKTQRAIEKLKEAQGDLTRQFDNLHRMEQYGKEVVGPTGPGGESAGSTVLTTGDGTTGAGGQGGGMGGTNTNTNGGVICPVPGPLP